MTASVDFTISFASETLAAFLHDRDLLRQEWAREGIEQLRRGELVGR